MIENVPPVARRRRPLLAWMMTLALTLGVASPGLADETSDGNWTVAATPVAGALGGVVGAGVFAAGAAAFTFAACPIMRCPTVLGTGETDLAIYIVTVPTAAIFGGAFGAMGAIFVALYLGADE